MPSKKPASEIKKMVEAQAKGKQVKAAEGRNRSRSSELDERQTKIVQKVRE